MSAISRRRFLQSGSLASAAVATGNLWSRAASAAETPQPGLLSEFSYGDVLMASDLHETQLMTTHSVLMALSEDSLLKPLRQMSGMPAPGDDLGGWYHYNPDYDTSNNFDYGFAPACTFGQWVSALARAYAINGDEETRQKVLRLNRLYAETISADFYIKNRFPAYCYDKLLLGLIDSHQFAGDRDALALLDRTTAAAVPRLPPAAVERELPWRPGKDQSYRWDESYTNPEYLFLAYRRGAGRRYRELAVRYLDDAT